MAAPLEMRRLGCSHPQRRYAVWQGKAHDYSKGEYPRPASASAVIQRVFQRLEPVGADGLEDLRRDREQFLVVGCGLHTQVQPEAAQAQARGKLGRDRVGLGVALLRRAKLMLLDRVGLRLGSRLFGGGYLRGRIHEQAQLEQVVDI